jgi:hypothetical protein
MNIGRFFKAIGNGFKIIGEDIYKGLSKTAKAVYQLIIKGKLVTVSEDGETLVTDSAAKLVTLIEDVAKISEAVAEDDTQTLTDITAFATAMETVVAAKGINILADATAATDLMALLKTINTTQFVDVIKAVQQVVKDAEALGTSATADLEKLISDAKS